MGHKREVQKSGETLHFRIKQEVRVHINQRADENGTSIVRCAMIEAGLSRDLDGIWGVEQLITELQQIILEYPEKFGDQITQQPQI